MVTTADKPPASPDNDACLPGCGAQHPDHVADECEEGRHRDPVRHRHCRGNLAPVHPLRIPSRRIPGPMPSCGARKPCHPMRPGRIRGSSRRAVPAQNVHTVHFRRADTHDRRAGSVAVPGADACCSDGRTAKDQPQVPFVGAGIRRVHDRHITSPRQVYDRLRRIQFVTGTLVAAALRFGHSAVRHGAVPAFHPCGGDADSVTAAMAASMRWRGPIRQPACTASELGAGSLSCDLVRLAGWGKIAVRVCPSAVLDHGPRVRMAVPAGPEPGVQGRGDYRLAS